MKDVKRKTKDEKRKTKDWIRKTKEILSCEGMTVLCGNYILFFVIPCMTGNLLKADHTKGFNFHLRNKYKD